MMVIFSDLIEKVMEVFMDDFPIYGKTFEDCLANLDKVLKRCQMADLVLNWENCHFMVQEGIFLGHKISEKRIEVDKAKIEVIEQLPPPTNVKGIRSFLGHAGFYRRFIQNFSQIDRPLMYLLAKDAMFVFMEECLQSFHTLKKALISAPDIQPPDWRLPFEIMCDAVIMLLEQCSASQRIRSIMYILRKQDSDWTPAELCHNRKGTSCRGICYQKV
jgi:hypothetical protein